MVSTLWCAELDTGVPLEYVSAGSTWWGGVGIHTSYILCPTKLSTWAFSFPLIYKWSAPGDLLQGPAVCWQFSPLSQYWEGSRQLSTPTRSWHTCGMGDTMGDGIQPFEILGGACNRLQESNQDWVHSPWTGPGDCYQCQIPRGRHF